MIASLEGVLRHKSPEEVVVDCGGVGYGVVVPLSTYGRLPEIGQPVTLLAHTHVRDDAIQLFGFFSALEKALFKRLIGISGVGPKVAMLVMSGASPEDLVATIQTGDVRRLTLVPGIGRKTAERIVLELRDKLLDLAAMAPAATAERRASLPTRHPVKVDVVSALVNLGFKAQMAEDAVEKTTREGVEDFERVLRASLRLLAPGGA